MRTWTPEARAAQSALIKRHKPWTRATGPKTPAGKARAARNSFKTGRHAKPLRDLRTYFRDCRAFLRFLKTKCYEAPPNQIPVIPRGMSFRSFSEQERQDFP